ncbi:MAG: acyl-CoA dehydratase activase, partial [Syntrophales bacterium]|nr:acyl-CoA dehydratase activase [Syntrophales bacterium]
MFNQDYRQSSPFCGGLEIGAVSVKWVGKDDGAPVVKILRHEGNPQGKVLEIIDRHLAEGNARVVVTGLTAKALFDLPYRTETECLEAALFSLRIKPDILLSLGGETFTVYPMKNGEVKNIISSSKCAAGTGEFIVQQFHRMGFSLEDGLRAVGAGELVPLATRCSVHCKTDVTHKLNKGECTPSDIARSLIYDLAKKIYRMIELTNWPADLIVMSGGLSLNEPFIEALRGLLPHSRLIIPRESPYLEAFGACLYACELSEGAVVPARAGNWLRITKPVFETLRPLREAEALLDYRVLPDTEPRLIEGDSYILGVDVGSTTTKAVLLNLSDLSIGASCYLRTHGNPIQATKECLRELIKQVGNKDIAIIQAGITGSGREIVSVFLDNCLSFNEILAHARAAAHEAPGIDTVFEIGGQDAKFIHFLKGVPVDYAMNEGCSAGTGSFLEESALRDMGVDVEEISGITSRSAHPVAFGERCAAFISTDLRNALQQGTDREDVIAGLVYSIADNYISRVVGTRHVGDAILFQGGVALNRAVALALAARTSRQVVVPHHPEFMGAIGAAMMVRDRLNREDAEVKPHTLEEFVSGSMEVKGTFRCPACENRCEIKKIALRDRIYPFGGLCSRYELRRRTGKETKEGRDLVAVRNALMFGEFGPKQLADPRGTIGLPM